MTEAQEQELEQFAEDTAYQIESVDYDSLFQLVKDGAKWYQDSVEEKLLSEIKDLKTYIIDTAKYGLDNETIQARAERYKEEGYQ